MPMGAVQELKSLWKSAWDHQEPDRFGMISFRYWPKNEAQEELFSVRYLDGSPVKPPQAEA